MYLPFIDDEGNEYGSFEVFYFESGWYWWACFPGCLPDGEAWGPFDTEQQAINDARSV